MAALHSRVILGSSFLSILPLTCELPASACNTFMLRRGDSDFAWFRQRAGSLHSDSLAHYTEMASTAINGEGHLNPEPSQPEERAEYELPPKSYAEAANPTIDHHSAHAVEKKPDSEKYGGVNGSVSVPTVNGQLDHQQQLDETKFIYEKHVNENGEILTSIKPTEVYEESLKHNGETAPHQKTHKKPVRRQDKTQDDLASGRKAGAGWERSAYAQFLP